MHKFVVYTALTGSESVLNDPFPPDCRGFERICFTDDLSIAPNGWTLVDLKPHYLDPARESRRPKLLPHVFLPEFEWSLWIDNTIRLKIDPAEILRQHIDKGQDFWCFRHPYRDCIYDEGEEVIRLGYDDERRVREQLDYYRQLEHPRHAGLASIGFLLRKHNEARICQLGAMWFEHVLRFSRRDQLSFNFVARRMGFDYGLFDGEITDNRFVTWPGYPRQVRLPKDFDPQMYQVLNPEVRESGLTPRQHFESVGLPHGLLFSRKRWELDRLANRYRSDRGSLYHSAHAYAPIYESYFEPLRSLPIKLLDLGRLRTDTVPDSPAGSLDDAANLLMWSDYFADGQIFGFDPARSSAAAKMDRVTLIPGDAGNPAGLSALLANQPGGFDIIIDEASHTSRDPLISLGILFPALKEGGFYCIEGLNDLSPDPGAKQAPTTKELLLGLSRGRLLKGPFLNEGQLEYLAQSSASIEFYDSFARNLGRVSQDDLVVIRKGPQAAPGELEQYWLHRERVEAELAEKGRVVQALAAGLAQSQHMARQFAWQLDRREAQVSFLTSQAVDRDAHLRSLSAQLSEIKASTSWRAAMLLSRLRVLLAPPGSLRARLATYVLGRFRYARALVAKWRVARDIALIRNSTVFDARWYLAHNPDVASAGLDPAAHYLVFGGFESRDPGPAFSSAWYLDEHSDVTQSGTNPLLHYLRAGRREGRPTAAAGTTRPRALPSTEPAPGTNTSRLKSRTVRFVAARAGHALSRLESMSRAGVMQSARGFLGPTDGGGRQAPLGLRESVHARELEEQRPEPLEYAHPQINGSEDNRLNHPGSEDAWLDDACLQLISEMRG